MRRGDKKEESYVKQKKKKLSFASNDLSKGKSLWNLSLVGYSLRPHPYYERLLAAMEKGLKFKGSLSLLSLADNFFPSWYSRPWRTMTWFGREDPGSYSVGPLFFRGGTKNFKLNGMNRLLFLCGLKFSIFPLIFGLHQVFLKLQVFLAFLFMLMLWLLRELDSHLQGSVFKLTKIWF